MEQIINIFSDGVSIVDNFVWGWPMIILLIGTHIFMTFRTRGIQRKIFTAIKLSIRNENSKDGISQFGALTTALAATIGSGNIVGVSTAILAGGPGAVFWMWLTGVLGMATKYAEAYISIKYRVKGKNSGFIGGAMYALERGLKHKKLGRILAILFAIFTIIATFGIGVSVQSNTLTGAVQNCSLIPNAGEIPSWTIGIVCVIAVGIVSLGGVKKISKVCSSLVPAMAAFFMITVFCILVLNYTHILDALRYIIIGAFSPSALAGGAIGVSISIVLQYGFKRGLFSNESGLGSAPIVAAKANTRNPARQALVSMTGTFWDTVVICALTGIAVTTAIVSNPDILNTYLNTFSGEDPANIYSSGIDLLYACVQTIPIFGEVLLTICLISFTYSTMIGWSAYADSAMIYLFGNKSTKPFYVILLVFVFWGCIGGGQVVWNLSDISNALMAIPNLIAVLALSTIIAKETKYYVYSGHIDERCEDPIPVVDK